MSQAEALIDLTAIRDNTALLAAAARTEVMAVVKADGYGHGIVPAARAALAGGATWLGVCTVDEAMAVRGAGITAPMLAWLIGPDEPVSRLLQSDVDVSAADVRQLDAVARAARELGVRARVHLKIDTGLSRNGSAAAAWPALVGTAARLRAEGAMDVVGVWSHLACADEPGHPSVKRQLVAFDEACAAAERAGLRPALRHIANSAGALDVPESRYDLVRPGIALYGYSPIPGRDFGLRPAMTLRGQVIVVKRVPAGQGVSYGHHYTTTAETTLALVPLGYADGVSRAASNTGPLLLGGSRRTIAGRVCMDQIVVDVGDDPVRVGDHAVLFGPGADGEPTADDWAGLLGTISYEILTRVGPRVRRVYRGEDAWHAFPTR